MNEEESFGGGDHVPDGGYSRLIHHLAEGLDIRLSNPVSRVEYDDSGVTIQTKGGTVYSGSHVIVTVPLGVLKSGHFEFNPPLPKAKRTAIQRLDMGNLEKVILRFDALFWTAFQDQAAMFLDKSEPGRFPFFVDMTRFAGAPTLVCLYGGGSSRRTQDRAQDEEIVAAAIEALSEILGGPVPTPSATHVTRWRSDPFSRGSYSFIPVGASPEDMHELARPVADRVLFAGEATYFDHYGTVHGAILSGVREAERFGAKKNSIPGL